MDKLSHSRNVSHEEKQLRRWIEKAAQEAEAHPGRRSWLDELVGEWHMHEGEYMIRRIAFEMYHCINSHDEVEAHFDSPTGRATLLSGTHELCWRKTMIFRIHFGTRWRIFTLRETEAFLNRNSAWLKAITRIERL